MESVALKLRLSPDEVRLRLDDREIDRLGAGERLEDALPELGLRWSCRLGEAGDRPTLQIEGGHLAFEVPRPIADDWLTGRQIALESNLAEGPTAIRLTLERDLRRRGCRPSAPHGDPLR